MSRCLSPQSLLKYWQQHGGLAQQGYPLSDEFPEKSLLDGKTYTVQYFERAIFEHHPANVPPYDVLLSQLGTFRYRDRPAPGAGTYPGKIVFDTERPNTLATISVINPDGTGRAQVATGRSPLFGPAGAHIAYLAVPAPAGSPGAPFGRVAIRTSGPPRVTNAARVSVGRGYCSAAGGSGRPAV